MERIDDATYRLTVINLSPDDTGPYTIEATNDTGTAASQANVEVERTLRRRKDPLEFSKLKSRESRIQSHDYLVMNLIPYNVEIHCMIPPFIYKCLMMKAIKRAGSIMPLLTT
uniref:Immunoglobulin I-set domain-containing protein n=1 Tax=Romanomermis culicivorax TaxID=13658 RepID=A0A915KCF7_ROMCU